MQIEMATVWMYVGIFSTVLAGVLLALLLYNRRERRRYRAVEVAQELGSWGLKKIAAVLLAYGVGDYSGLAKAVDALVDRLKADGLPKLLTEAFWKLLAHNLGEEDGRKRIREELEAAEGKANSRAGIVPTAEKAKK